MDTNNELTSINQHQETPLAALLMRFVANNEITSQEVDLVMAALDDLMAEMQRLEGTSSNPNHVSGGQPC